MISEPTPGGRGSAATTYEQLRDHVLEGTTAGVFGLIVLMREGVAAWLAHAAVPPVEITHAKEPFAATPIVSHDIHADMICVLANMAMAIPHRCMHE
jgi:hypothetical protein